MLRRSKAVAAVAALAVTLAALQGLSAFTGVAQPRHRPAGQFVVVENLPKGMVCRAMPENSIGLWQGADKYGIQDTRREWDPVPRWRGESTWRARGEIQGDSHRQWYHFDAEGKTLGWIAQAVARVLMGKDSPLWDGRSDVGAYVVVTNCEKVRVTGKKYHYKLYFRNLSFKPGHLKCERFKDILNRFPERIMMKAVWGSMPTTAKARRVFKERLKLFTGPNHLYYDKDPVEYPMHLLKDCLHTHNVPRRLQILEMYKKRIPKNRELTKIKKDIEAAKKLTRYKDFLKNQLATEGDEAVERMEMDELALHGEQKRMNAILEEFEGKPANKGKLSMYTFPKMRRRKIKQHWRHGKPDSLESYDYLMAKRRNMLGETANE